MIDKKNPPTKNPTKMRPRKTSNGLINQSFIYIIQHIVQNNYFDIQKCMCAWHAIYWFKLSHEAKIINRYLDNIA